jgi:hypothetical protein
MSRGHGRVERYVLAFVQAARQMALDSTDEQIYLWEHQRPLPTRLDTEARVVQVGVLRALTLMPTASSVARALGQGVPADSIHGHIPISSLPPATSAMYESVRRAIHLLLRDGRLQRMWPIFDPAPNLHVSLPGCDLDLRALKDAMQADLGRHVRWTWSSTPTARPLTA